MYTVKIKGYNGGAYEENIDADTYSINNNVVSFYDNYKLVKVYSLFNIISFDKRI